MSKHLDLDKDLAVFMISAVWVDEPLCSYLDGWGDCKDVRQHN